MMSILACQCGKLDATCGVGFCDGASYCEGAGCSDAVCFPEDSDVSMAMCDGVVPGDCNSVSISGYCAGNSFCQGSSCLPGTAPISELACNCGLLSPTCGAGECIEGSYCTGWGCPDPMCFSPTSPVSLAMCGGFPLIGCSLNCDPPTDEVAHWPLDETRTTSVFTSEWNPDDFVGSSVTNFAQVTQYIPPQRDVTAFGLGDDWSGTWFPSAPASLAIELFDSVSDSWVPVYTLPWSAALFAGQSWTISPPLGMVTAIRWSSYGPSNTLSPNDDFQGFGFGTMFFTSDTTLRPKDIVGRNHGTASDALQYRTISGPNAPTPVAGQVRGALSFDGVGDVVVAPVHHKEDGSAQRATHAYDKQLSIEAWIRPASIDGTPRTILAFSDEPSNTVLYAMRLVGNEIELEAAGNGSPPIHVSTVNAGIVAGNWYHVSFTASLVFQTVAAYVNGANTPLLSFITTATGALPSGDRWLIGRDATSTTSLDSFNGRIDEVKVFERIRLPGEIAAAVAAGPNGTCQRALFMTSPHNGKIYEGINDGRLVPVSGYSLVAGQPVRIEALNQGSGQWDFVGSTTASFFADATGMYPWSVSVLPQLPPIPFFTPPTRWRDTGLAWLRVRSNGSPSATKFDGITMDDPLCLAENAPLTGLDLVTNCRGNLGPIATLADSDNKGQTAPFFPPVEAKTFQYLPNNLQPPPGVVSKHHYLWKKYPAPKTNATAYYAAVDAGPGSARSTLNGWLQVNGFPGASNTVHTVYFNAGDLRLGRDMYCREVRACEGTQPLCAPSSAACGAVVRIACSVTNYAKKIGAQRGGTAFGSGAGGPAYEALDKAIQQLDPAATVSMESLLIDPAAFPFQCNNPSPSVAPSAANRVRFYVHDIQGNTCSISGPGGLCTEVALDSEQNKPVPDVCMACHGGTVSTQPAIDDANFIAFDVGSFFYWSDPGSPYSYAAQEDAFRQLNALVLESNPKPAIKDLINGFYDRKGPTGSPLQSVTTPFNPAYFEYVPERWAGYDPTYQHVPKPYCRTCHLSQGLSSTSLDPINWLSFGDFVGPSLLFDACPGPNSPPRMPQAEVTYKVFWRHGARADLVNATMAFNPCAP